MLWVPQKGRITAFDIVPFTIYIHSHHWDSCPIERFGQHLLNDKNRSRVFLGIFEVFVGPGPFPIFVFFMGTANGPKQIMNEDTFTQTFLPKTQNFDKTFLPRFWQKKRLLSHRVSVNLVWWLNRKKKNANPINPEGFKNIHHSSPKQWSTATSFPIMPSFLLQSNRILKVGMVIPPIFPKVPQSSLGILRAPHFLSPIWHLLFAGHGECLLFGPGTMPLNMMAGKTTKC